MFFDEAHHLVVGVDQVGPDDEAVVIAVKATAAQKAVELVGGSGPLNSEVIAEK